MRVLLALVGVGLIAWGFVQFVQLNVAAGATTFAIAFVVLLVAGVMSAMSAQTACEICQTPLGRTRYTWIDEAEQEKIVCPNCNRGLKRKQSRDALRNRHG